MKMGKFNSARRPKRSFKGNQHIEITKINKKKVFQRRPKQQMLTSLLVEGESTQTSRGNTSSPVGSLITEDAKDIPVASSTPKIKCGSASFTKLHTKHLFDKDALQNVSKTSEGYRFIDLSILSAVFNLLACPECQNTSIELFDDLSRKNGCASSLHLCCMTCYWSHQFSSSERSNGTYEVNRRYVYAMRSIGQGFSGAKKFCCIMNIPSLPSKNNYAKIVKALKTAAFNVAKDSMKSAADELKCNTNDECAVSVDGSWQKCGYTSLNGCVTAISIESGKILDIEPMSRYCKECEVHEKLSKGSCNYLLWKERHTNCGANFKGSAPAMEPEGAARIFERSLQEHGLYYTKYYGDGDSKSFQRVEDVYKNDGKLVEKLECIGHVQKRMGAALRNLRREKKETRGKGKLTDRMIDRLQNYYGIAIRSNIGNLEGMKKAILATLFHCASSSTKEYHTYCPIGPESWCRFQSDKANGTASYKSGPGLPLQLVAELKPVFARLSSDKLLLKCLHGKTQNRNESFNRTIWDRVPKSSFVGKDTFELGVYDAAASFNMGATASLEILKQCGFKPGMFTEKHCSEIDKIRLNAAEYRAQDSSKLARKRLRSKKKSYNDKQKEKEGDTYAPGAF